MSSVTSGERRKKRFPAKRRALDFKTFLANYFDYLIIFLIPFLICYNWFILPGVPHHGDLSFPISLDQWLARFYPLQNLYDSISNFENVDRFYAMYLPALLAKILGISMETFIKLYLILIVSLSGISFNYAQRYFLSKLGFHYDNYLSKIWFIVTSIIFMFSPWVLEQIQAPFYHLAYSLTPLFIAKLDDYLEAGSKLVLLILALLFVVIASTPHYTVFTLILAIIYFIVFFIFICMKTKSDNSKKVLLRFIIMIIIFLGSNTYWILPYLYTWLIRRPVTPGYMLTLEDVYIFSRNSVTLNVIRGLDQWITWYKNDLYDTGLWKFCSFITPLISLIALVYLLLNIKREQVRFKILITYLALLFIIFSFLGHGTNMPMYNYLIFAFEEIGWIFRVPTKLTYILWFIYPMTLTLFYCRVLRNKRELTALLLLLTIASSHFVTVGNKVIDYYTFYYAPVNIPKPYYELYEYLKSHPELSKVLFMAPYYDGMGKNALNFETSFTWNNKRLAGYSIHASSPIPSIGTYHITTPYKKVVDYLHYCLRNNISSCVENILKILGVNSIVYHNDIVGATEAGLHDIELLKQFVGGQYIRFSDYLYLFMIQSTSSKDGYHTFFIPRYVIITSYNFSKLCTVDPYEYALVFVDEYADPYIFNTILKMVYNNSHSVALVLENDLDLVLGYVIADKNSVEDKIVVVQPFKYTYYGWGAENRWVRAYLFNTYDSYYYGVDAFLRWKEISLSPLFDYGIGIAYTFGKGAKLEIPFYIKREGNYSILIRLLTRGTLELYVDHSKVYTISCNQTQEVCYRLSWVNLGVLRLDSGWHKIEVINMDSHTSIINVMVFIHNDYITTITNMLHRIEEMNILKRYEIKPSNYIEYNEKFFKIKIINNSFIEVMYEGAESNVSHTWSDIQLPPIEVYNGLYLIETLMKIENAEESHIHIDYLQYNPDSRFMIGACPTGRSGYSEYEVYRCILAVPRKGKLIFSLNAGWNYKKEEISKTIFGPISIRPIILYNLSELIGDFDLNPVKAEIIGYTRIDSTYYVVKVNASSPFLLVFAYGYEPYWEARVYKGGKLIERVRSIPVYGVVNGFWIDATGNLTVVIRYAPQDWYELGLKVSGSTFVLGIFYLVWDWRRGRGDKWVVMIERVFKKFASQR